MSLVKGNVPLTGATLLIQEYGEDLELFVKELIGEIEKRKIMDQLEYADLLGAIQGLGFKKGKAIFTTWRRKQLARIEEIDDNINEDQLNVFEKLIRQNKPKTVFDSLIASKRK